MSASHPFVLYCISHMVNKYQGSLPTCNTYNHKHTYSKGDSLFATFTIILTLDEKIMTSAICHPVNIIEEHSFHHPIHRCIFLLALVIFMKYICQNIMHWRMKSYILMQLLCLSWY